LQEDSVGTVPVVDYTQVVSVPANVLMWNVYWWTMQHCVLSHTPHGLSSYLQHIVIIIIIIIIIIVVVIINLFS